MRDPWRSFTQQPWTFLLKIAGATTAIALGIELVLMALFQFVSPLQYAIETLYDNPLAPLLPVAIAIGFGALSLIVWERWPNSIRPDTPRLWALLLCLLGGLAVKTLLPLPGQFLELSGAALVGTIVGVFWKGRPYWGMGR